MEFDRAFVNTAMDGLLALDKDEKRSHTFIQFKVQIQRQILFTIECRKESERKRYIQFATERTQTCTSRYAIYEMEEAKLHFSSSYFATLESFIIH